METLTQRWKTLWRVQTSVRYHERRLMFFERWRRTTAFLSVLLGSAAAADVLRAGGHQLALAASFAVSVLAAFELVIGTGEMARKHDDLRRRFIKLEAKILGEPEPSQETVNAWCSDRLDIESDEPPTYKALDLLCENEQAIATGTKRWVPLSKLQRATAQWKHWENLTPRVIEIADQPLASH